MNINRENPFNKENEGVVRGSMAEVNTGSPIFIKRINMAGKMEAVHHPNFIKLLDLAMDLNDLSIMSIEQERYFKTFISDIQELNETIAPY